MRLITVDQRHPRISGWQLCCCRGGGIEDGNDGSGGAGDNDDGGVGGDVDNGGV